MEWLYRFADLASSVDPRVIQGCALAVALAALFLTIRNRRHDSRQKLEDEARRTSEKGQDLARAEAAAREQAERDRQAFLDSFRPFSLSCEVEGETVHVAWGGRLDEIMDVRDARPMTPALVDALFPALSRFRVRNLQPFLRVLHGVQNPQTVYETSADRTWKRMLHSTAPTDYGSVLRVVDRAGPPSSYCPRCGQLGNGNNCVHCPHLGPEPPRFRNPG